MPFSIAVPNKGRLCEDTLELLRRTGIRVVAPDSRLIESLEGGKVNVLFVRAQDIPGYVASGSVDLGVTGRDLVEEQGLPVEMLLDLNYGKCRLVLASPQASKGSKVAAGSRVATPFPNLARKYLQKLGVQASVIPVSGATEVRDALDLPDDRGSVWQLASHTSFLHVHRGQLNLFTGKRRIPFENLFHAGALG